MIIYEMLKMKKTAWLIVLLVISAIFLNACEDDTEKNPPGGKEQLEKEEPKGDEVDKDVEKESGDLEVDLMKKINFI